MERGEGRREAEKKRRVSRRRRRRGGEGKRGGENCRHGPPYKHAHLFYAVGQTFHDGAEADLTASIRFQTNVGRGVVPVTYENDSEAGRLHVRLRALH
jgi:hypothetical protein